MMNDVKYLSEIILKGLKSNEAMVMASIVIMEGSAPRGSGTKMVIADAGRNYGTIGGGKLEAQVISDSGGVLKEQKSKFIEIDLTGTDTNSEDMICGGKTVILLDRFAPTDGNKKLFSLMNTHIAEGKSFYLVTAYTEDEVSMDVLGHSLFFSDGRTEGDDVIEPAALGTIREELHNMSSTTILTVRDRKYIVDPVRRTKTLYCFGAGHVAVPTIHLATMVGFNAVVIDDREEFANKGRFPEADRVVVIDDYNRGLESFDIDADSFIIIVTRGHRFDREVLQHAVKTKAGYIGMISSRNKRDSVYRALLADGLATEEELEKVHSPIGLAIGAETPEEIAVSIVGELIYERGRA